MDLALEDGIFLNGCEYVFIVKGFNILSIDSLSKNYCMKNISGNSRTPKLHERINSLFPILGRTKGKWKSCETLILTSKDNTKELSKGTPLLNEN